MLKSLTKRLLRKAGFEITRLPERQTKSSSERRASGSSQGADPAAMLASDPLDANAHLGYACSASKSGNAYLAYAELKTAECLGADRNQVEQHATAFRAALPDSKYMNHNQYFRFRSLSSELVARAGSSEFSVLDIGGGGGELVAFLPEKVRYCLAEPAVNGISGTRLPFPGRSFDYVVACHVLEHVPVAERTAFLDQLSSKARRGVVLLNPFHVEGTYVEERLELIVETTGAEWAKEHLGCTLPKLDDIRAYAANNGLQLSVKANGTLATSIAFVFVDYFAGRSGCTEEWRKLNAFFNEKYAAILDSATYPNAYLVYLGRPEAQAIAARQSAAADKK